MNKENAMLLIDDLKDALVDAERVKHGFSEDMAMHYAFGYMMTMFAEALTKLSAPEQEIVSKEIRAATREKRELIFAAAMRQHKV